MSKQEEQFLFRYINDRSQWTADALVPNTTQRPQNPLLEMDEGLFFVILVIFGGRKIYLSSSIFLKFMGHMYGELLVVPNTTKIPQNPLLKVDEGLFCCDFGYFWRKKNITFEFD
jgi:hypothetical protein